MEDPLPFAFVLGSGLASWLSGGTRLGASLSGVAVGAGLGAFFTVAGWLAGARLGASFGIRLAGWLAWVI